MFKFSFLAAVAAVVSVAAVPALSQDLGNSPYSRYGLGDLAPGGSLRNSAMAGVGVSSPATYQINDLNPALLPFNQLVTFEIAASSQLKRIETRTTSQQDGNVSLRYLAFAFPVSKSWTTGLGLRPFSSVNYKILTEAPVQNDSTLKARYLYRGTGGITEVYWSNGVRLGKHFSAGLQASYLFGSISNEAVTQILTPDNVPQGNIVSLTDRRTLNDISLKGGLAYRTQIADTYTLGLGATYQHLFDFEAKQLRTFASSANNIAIDTLPATIDERPLKVPQPMQFGISLENGNRWMLGLDYHTQDWGKFVAFGEPAGTLKRSYRIALGAEYTPDPSSVTSYLKRVTYRAGISTGKTPISINGRQLDEQQASLGFTLPTGRMGSVINTAFVAGRRGTTENGLIKETFYRFELGLSLNDRWFQKQRVD